MNVRVFIHPYVANGYKLSHRTWPLFPYIPLFQNFTFEQSYISAYFLFSSCATALSIPRQTPWSLVSPKTLAPHLNDMYIYRKHNYFEVQLSYARNRWILLRCGKQPRGVEGMRRR
ncbi:hypothetical protein POVWA2_024990 [Plasmodium ovale wallikeri]|uniref:Uncharacterized protein n=1 Tax=Plasmodium ovale wallikeri TaxID=864142 RepID=A0A1A8YTL9_PLAOA|nr:hypothetical protein POVWA1_025150 [Plasmodium ovale wallikeri]SBT35427.1 hypothetical protein POVWA2_024990 [Plasmodium ovale wallikeri]